jgi:hypothetical protein
LWTTDEVTKLELFSANGSWLWLLTKSRVVGSVFCCAGSLFGDSRADHQGSISACFN